MRQDREGIRQKGAPGPHSRLAFAGRVGYQPHMAKDSIDQLARKLAETVPDGLRAVRDDLEKNFRAVLKSGISRMDLVTREEFEIQQSVLRRTRETLAALETRLAELEAAGPATKKIRKKAAAKKAGTRKKPASKKPAAKKKASRKAAGKKG